MEQFTDSYLNGNTPNPCIECNRHIKFDKMLQRAEELGFDYIATDIMQKWNLMNKTEDISWSAQPIVQKIKLMSCIHCSAHQLAHTLFPLGNLDKKHVRQIVEEAGLIILENQIVRISALFRMAIMQGL